MIYKMRKRFSNKLSEKIYNVSLKFEKIIDKT